MVSDTGRRLGELLVEAGAARPADVEAAAEAGRQEHRLMTRILEERYGVEEAEIFRALSRKYGLQFTTADALLPEIDPTLATALPQRFCEFNRLVPIRRQGRTVVLATCDPFASFPELPHAPTPATSTSRSSATTPRSGSGWTATCGSSPTSCSRRPSSLRW